MNTALRKKTRAELVGFNERNRDVWVANIAQRLPAGTRILDVGAGECRYKPLFAHCDYKAQDFTQFHGQTVGTTQQEWHYGQIDYVSDATDIPVDDATFDAVLCTEVLEHVPEPIKVLKEIGRIVRPGGRIFISAPLGSGLHQQPYHFYGGYTPYFYARFLTEFGFTEIDVKPNGHFFRLLLQELNRAVYIIRARRSYPLWHLARWLLWVANSGVVARWFDELDDEVPIDEFTVGYHVEAVKNR